MNEGIELKRKSLIWNILSPEVFKAVFLAVSVISVCPLIVKGITPFLKLFHVYGIIVLLVDLFTEKRILRNQGRMTLVLFTLFYMVTLLSNVNLISFSGISNFGYLFITLCLVYSYGKDSQKKDWISGNIICILITLVNVAGIWMFFTKYYVYTPGNGFIGMYPFENRLCGLFGNPAVLSMVAVVGFFMSVILAINARSRKLKIFYALQGSINCIAVLLGNARASILALIIMCVVFVFFQLLRKKKTSHRIVLAGAGAILTGVLAFMGVRLLQYGLSALDLKYDYYYNNICWENPLNLPSEEANGAELELEEGEDFVHSDFEPTIRRADSGFNGRWELWMIGLRMFGEKPLFGHGLDNHDYALEQMGENKLPITGNLHNTYLDIIVCCGLAGLLCLAAFLFITLRNAIYFFKYNDGSSWNQGAILVAAMSGFMALAMADSTLVASVYPTAVAFWYITSQFADLSERENQKSGHACREMLSVILENKLRKRD